MIPSSKELLRTAAEASAMSAGVVMLSTAECRSIGELLSILEQINWQPLSNVQPSSLEEVDGYYCIEVLIPAKHAIGKVAYWERVLDDNGALHRCSALNDACLADLRLARQHHGQTNVRLVRCTKSVVAGSA